MSESQSRYSIVERLTEKKLDLMNQKAGLNSEVTNCELRAAKLKADLTNWQKDIQEDIKRSLRQKEIEVERATQEAKDAKTRLSEKAKSFDEQIKAVELAISSIEEISKTAPSSN